MQKQKKMFKTKNEIELIDFIYSTVNPIMSEIKELLDELEKKTGDKYWTLAKYKEFLFY